MTIELELGASSLELDDGRLVTHIPRSLFTPKQWRRLVKKLAQVQEHLQWLRIPFQTAQQKDARWKKIFLDTFSMIVYLLVIPPGHNLVQLIQAIDWGKIDEWGAEVYENAKQGARAYAPQVLFRLCRCPRHGRMLLLMALYGVCFESRLVDQIATNMAWRWFCGFGVLTPIPTAATLCYFRKRLGAERFACAWAAGTGETILHWLILQCYQAGLITLEEAYFDFTGVEASATQLTPYQRVVVLAKALNAYVEGLDNRAIAENEEIASVLHQLIIEVAQEVLGEQHPSVEKLSVEQLARSLDRLNERVEGMPRGARWWQCIRQALREWWQRVPDAVEEGAALLNQLARATEGTDQRDQALATLRDHLCQVGEALKPTIPHAWGDLSARVGTLSKGCTVCGYQVGYLVDGAHDVIIGLVSMAANAAQAPQVKVVLDKTKRLLGSLPRRLGLDSAFDQDQVYVDLEDKPVEPFVVSRDHRAPKGCFGPDRFVFDEDGELCCPAGKPMKEKYGPYKDDRVVYEGGDCTDCPLRPQCVPETKEIRCFSTKPESHRRWLENRTKSQSEEGDRILKQRFAREGVFGHANTHHNGDRAPYRDGEMNAIADCLTAFAINLEKLAAHQASTVAA